MSALILYRPYLNIIFTCILVVGYVNDSAAQCELYTQDNSLTFNYRNDQNITVKSPTPFTVEPDEFNIRRQLDAWQLSHNYLVLNFPRNIPDAPSTNGYLHRTVLGYSQITTLGDRHNTGRLHWSLLPTMAISSNQLKHLDTLDKNSFRVDGQLVWEYDKINLWSGFAGVCLAALSGEHELLPVIGLRYKNTKWMFAVAYPKTEIIYSVSPSLNIQGNWSLSGNQWSVLNKQLDERSDFNFKSQRLELGVNLAVSKHSSMKLAWLYQLDNEISYQSSNGSRITAELEDSYSWLIGYRYSFGD